MERTERLLDLIALFLDAREPLSWGEIRGAFPDDYGKGSAEGSLRKFERDKAELAELGITLRFQPETEESKGGYVLAREDYYLPQLDLGPEEMAVLYAAGSAALASGAFPGRADLANALRKIAFTSPDDPGRRQAPLFAELGPGRAEVAERLERLWQALLSRKRVRLRYQGLGRAEETERMVDPWGVCLRRGVWVLVGFCHLRQARRTFHLDRVLALEVNRERPRTPDYEVPADFHIDEVAAEQVWEHRFHEPVEVAIRLSPELVALAPRLFPGGRVEADTIRVTATCLDALLRRVLSLGEGAVVVGPERALVRVREMLDRIERVHLPAERVA